MDKKITLLLLLSLLGILTLLLISQHLEPDVSKISGITKERIGEHIKIRAEIISIRSLDNLQIFLLQDSTGNISAVAYSKNFSIEKSREYVFLGEVSEYEKEIQITINKIHS